MSFKKKLITCTAIAGTSVGIMHIINRFICYISSRDDFLYTKEQNYYDWTYGRIFFTKQGSGAPILLIHDLDVCSSSYEWNKLKAELSKTNTIYTIDLLGCGLSEKPNITYTNFLYVQLITDFIKNVIEEKTDIITTGHSASIVLMACANDDSIINRMMLINPESMMNSLQFPKYYDKLYRNLIYTPIIGTFIYNLVMNKNAIKEKFMTDYFYDHARIREKDISAYIEASQTEKSHGKYLYANIKAHYTTGNTINCLTKINNNIYIITGNGNPENNLAASQYQNMLPSIEIVGINDVKQLPQLEAPEEVLGIIKDYLEL